MSFVQNSDILIKNCVFKAHLLSAQACIKFPCLFFMQWSLQSKQYSIITQNRVKAENQTIDFNEQLLFDTQMLYSKSKQKYLPKETYLTLNLISDNKPDQIKMVGRFPINLADVINLNAYCQSRRFQLQYCSVKGSLLFTVVTDMVKQSEFTLKDMQNSAIMDWQIYELRKLDGSLKSSYINNNFPNEEENYLEEEDDTKGQNQGRKLSQSAGSSLQKIMNLAKKDQQKQQQSNNENINKTSQREHKFGFNQDQNNAQDNIKNESDSMDKSKGQIIKFDEDYKYQQYPKSTLTKSIDKVRAIARNNEKEKCLELQLSLANDKIQFYKQEIELQKLQIEQLNQRLIQWQERQNKIEGIDSLDIIEEYERLKNQVQYLRQKLSNLDEQKVSNDRFSQQISNQQRENQQNQLKIQGKAIVNAQKKNQSSQNEIYEINIINDKQVYQQKQRELEQCQAQMEEMQKLLQKQKEKLQFFEMENVILKQKMEQIQQELEKIINQNGNKNNQLEIIQFEFEKSVQQNLEKEQQLQTIKVALEKSVQQNFEKEKELETIQIEFKKSVQQNLEKEKELESIKKQNLTPKKDLQFCKQEILMLSNKCIQLEQEKKQLTQKYDKLCEQYFKIQQLQQEKVQKINILEGQIKQRVDNEIGLDYKIKRLEKELQDLTNAFKINSETCIKTQNLQQIINQQQLEIIKLKSKIQEIENKKLQLQFIQTQFKEQNIFLRDQLELNIIQKNQNIQYQKQECKKQLKNIIQEYLTKISQYQINKQQYKNKILQLQIQIENMLKLSNNQIQKKNIIIQEFTQQIQYLEKQKISNYSQKQENNIKQIFQNQKNFEVKYQQSKIKIQFYKAEMLSQNLNHEEQINSLINELKNKNQRERQLIKELAEKNVAILNSEQRISHLILEVSKFRQNAAKLADQAFQIEEEAQIEKQRMEIQTQQYTKNLNAKIIELQIKLQKVQYQLKIIKQMKQIEEKQKYTVNNQIIEIENHEQVDNQKQIPEQKKQIEQSQRNQLQISHNKFQKLVQQNQKLQNQYNSVLIEKNNLINQCNNIKNIQKEVQNKQLEQQNKILLAQINQLTKQILKFKDQLSEMNKINEKNFEELVILQEKQFNFHSQNNEKQIQIMQLHQQNLQILKDFQTVRTEKNLLAKEYEYFMTKIQEQKQTKIIQPIIENHTIQTKQNKLRKQIEEEKINLQNEKFQLQSEIQLIILQKQHLLQIIQQRNKKEEQYKNQQQEYMYTILDLQIKLKQQQSKQSSQVILKRSFTQSNDQGQNSKLLTQNILYTCKQLKDLLDKKLNLKNYEQNLKQIIKNKLIYKTNQINNNNNNNITYLKNNQILEKIRIISKQLQKMKLQIMKSDNNYNNNNTFLSEKLKLITLLKPTEIFIKQLISICENLFDQY